MIKFDLFLIDLGSRKEAEIFDDLSPGEAKRRLAILAKKMDRDGDGYVTRGELEEVIKKYVFSQTVPFKNSIVKD